MYRYINVLLLLVFALSMKAQSDIPSMPKEGPTPTIHLGEPQSFTLDNGIQVLVVENHKLPRVYAKLTIDNPPVAMGDKKGADDLLGALFGTGSVNQTKKEYNEEIDFMGSRAFFSDSFFYINSLSRFFSKTFKLAVDQVLNPNFTQEEFDKEKNKLIEGLKSQEKSVETAASHLRAKVGYGEGHPFSEFSTPKSLERITLQDVKDYYHDYYRPNFAYLIIVGDVDFKEVKKIVTNTFSDWEMTRMNLPPVPQIKDAAQTEICFVDMPNAVQSKVSIVHSSSLRKNNPDYFDALIMNNIFGGDFNSYLNMNLREEHGWTYGARSNLSSNKYGGLFSAGASVRNEVTDSTAVECLNQVDKIINQVADAKQLETVKAGYKGNFIMAMEDPETVANYAVNIRKENLSKDFYKNYLTSIDAVTLENIQAAAKKYLHPENMRILIVGKAADILPAVEKLGYPIRFFDLNGKETKRPDLTIKLPEGVNLDGILDKYFEAIGGKKKVEAISSMEQKAKMNISAVPMPLSLTIKTAAPNKSYVEISLMGNTVNVIAFNGEKGYIEIQGEKKEMDAKMLKTFKSTVQPIEELSLYEKGKLIAEEEINGKVVYVIENGKDKYYFEEESGLLVQKISQEEQDGKIVSKTSSYINYESTKYGVKFPMKILQTAGDQDITIKMKKITINPSFENSVFE